MKVLESSLNLRVDRSNRSRRTNLDYSLSVDVAKEQLHYKGGADLYCNVEYMECLDEEYLHEFSQKGYKRITALFGQDNRGILCYIKKDYTVQIIKSMSDPHFLHFKASKDNKSYDIIIFRILVSKWKSKDVESIKKEFNERLKQWKTVCNYIDTMKDKSRIILTGDWNHARILPEYEEDMGQYYFSYQRIRTDLESRGISMGIDIQPGHKEHSYKGYLAIEHIAIGEGLSFTKKPEYSDYDKDAPIGKPDHAYLFAEIN